MTGKIIPITKLFVCLILVSISCKNSAEPAQLTPKTTSVAKAEGKASKQIQYDYRFVGKDEDGNHVHGSISIEGQIAIGNLFNKDGTEIEIVAEEVSKGHLIANDLDGYKYYLKIK